MTNRNQAPKGSKHPLETVGFIITVVSVLGYMAYVLWYVGALYPALSKQPGWSHSRHLMYTLIPGIPASSLAAFGYLLYELPRRGFRWGEAIAATISVVMGGLFVGWLIANAGR